MFVSPVVTTSCPTVKPMKSRGFFHFIFFQRYTQPTNSGTKMIATFTAFPSSIFCCTRPSHSSTTYAFVFHIFIKTLIIHFRHAHCCNALPCNPFPSTSSFHSIDVRPVPGPSMVPWTKSIRCVVQVPPNWNSQ